MKILFFVHSLRRGGAEKLLLQIASHLDRKGHEVMVVQAVDYDEYTEVEYSDIKKVSLIKTEEYKWPFIFPKLSRQFKKINQEYAPDLICAFSPIMVIIAAFAGVKNKFIHVVQGYGLVARDRSIKQRLYKLLDKISMYLLNYDVIVPTASLKDAFLSYIHTDSSKVKVIASGVDSINLQPNNNIEFTDKLIITMLGTVYKQKGQRYAVDALKELKILNPGLEVSILIIGSGSDLRFIQNKINKLGLSDSISLLGRRDDAFDLVASSHIFWHLSESEGMPLVIMEAMALGVPAIGFNVRGVNDIIDHGIDGYLASHKDMKAIANYTNSLILDKDNYKKFRINARTKIDQKYTIDNMLINYENHFIKSIQN